MIRRGICTEGRVEVDASYCNCQQSFKRLLSSDCHTSAHIFCCIICRTGRKRTVGLGLVGARGKSIDWRYCLSIPLELELTEKTGRNIILGCLYSMHLKEWMQFVLNMKWEWPKKRKRVPRNWGSNHRCCYSPIGAREQTCWGWVWLG